MAQASICRICLSKTERSHCTNFFSPDSIKCSLATRMSQLLEVPILKDDGMSCYVCRGCKGKFSTIENKLSGMRSVAKSSHQKLQHDIVPRKRPKNTSGTNEEVSPHTARSRPAAKRGTAHKRLFPDDNGKYITKKNKLQHQ